MREKIMSYILKQGSNLLEKDGIGTPYITNITNGELRTLGLRKENIDVQNDCKTVMVCNYDTATVNSLLRNLGYTGKLLLIRDEKILNVITNVLRAKTYTVNLITDGNILTRVYFTKNSMGLILTYQDKEKYDDNSEVLLVVDEDEITLMYKDNVNKTLVTDYFCYTELEGIFKDVLEQALYYYN